MSTFDQHKQKVFKQVNINIEAPVPLSNVSQVSPPVGDFVGREREIEQVLVLFEASRKKPGATIAGICGMGGVGKTELAKMVAKRLQEQFPDGQIMLDLQPARDDAEAEPVKAAEVLQHVIRSFRPNQELPESVNQLKGLYHSVLKDRHVLLLLDNALDAEQLVPLTPPPDGCALIITSRRHISLPGLQKLNLGTMPLDQACDMLCTICPRVGSHANRLAEMCGYLPLALRLSGAALECNPPLPVEEYLVRLGDKKSRSATLDKGRKLVGVERGLEASIAASYNLLDESLQSLWRFLSIFPSDFDAIAAAVVWQTDKHCCLQSLGDLYTASMIGWDESTNRYKLHDLLRSYARSRLTGSEETESGGRHAIFYAEVLRKTQELYLRGGKSLLEGLRLFDREWVNIAAGQHWAAANFRVSDFAANLCNVYPIFGAYCLSVRTKHLTYAKWCKAALAAARKVEDKEAEASHLGNLGITYAGLGQPNAALEHFGQQLALTREIGDKKGEANALASSARAYADLGRLSKAIENLELALEILQKEGDRAGQATVLGNLGITQRAAGNFTKAFQYHEEGLRLSREIGDDRGVAADLGGMANLHADLGQLTKAVELYTQALKIHREMGDLDGIACDLYNLTDQLEKAGRHNEALACAEEAATTCTKIHSSLSAKANARLEHLRKRRHL